MEMLLHKLQTNISFLTVYQWVQLLWKKNSVLDGNYKKLEFFCVLYFRENTQITILFHLFILSKNLMVDIVTILLWHNFSDMEP